MPGQVVMTSKASFRLGFYLWVVLWVATTAFMCWATIGLGLCAGLGIGTVMFWGRRALNRQHVGRLAAQYEALYGTHPGFDNRSQRYVGAAGALVGGSMLSAHAAVGGLVGAGLDYWRDRKRRVGMSAEQTALYDQLQGLMAWRPGDAYRMFVIGVLVSAGAVYAYRAMFPDLPESLPIDVFERVQPEEAERQ